MCLIALAWKVDLRRPLVLIANRDELYERPSAPLGFWSDAPDICGGRDLREGGSWLGLHLSGRLAAVTNVREADQPARRPRSRGELVTAFLQSRLPAAAFAESLVAGAAEYGGYNLLLWDGESLVYASNRPQARQAPVQAGLHGLSNARLDTPWPKVLHARRGLEHWLANPGAVAQEQLFAIMNDRRPAPDDQLPDTGLGLVAERQLSSAFIHRPGYGTRCTTLVIVGADGQVTMHERRYDSGGEVDGDSIEGFRLWR